MRCGYFAQSSVRCTISLSLILLANLPYRKYIKEKHRPDAFDNDATKLYLS
jgi:hypothetical protein